MEPRLLVYKRETSKQQPICFEPVLHTSLHFIGEVDDLGTQACACLDDPTHQQNSQSLRESDAEGQTLPLHQGCPVIQSSTA